MVSYTDGQGAGKSAESAALTVGASNRAPTFPSDTTSRSVLENTAAGQPVGDPLIVTDPDRDPLTVSLSGDSNPFDFDKSGEGATTTVQLRVSATADLDYEVRSSYMVVVSAVDGRGGSAATHCNHWRHQRRRGALSSRCPVGDRGRGEPQRKLGRPCQHRTGDQRLRGPVPDQRRR